MCQEPVPLFGRPQILESCQNDSQPAVPSRSEHIREQATAAPPEFVEQAWPQFIYERQSADASALDRNTHAKNLQETKDSRHYKITIA